jgi:hypothetical protein
MARLSTSRAFCPWARAKKKHEKLNKLFLPAANCKNMEQEETTRMTTTLGMQLVFVPYLPLFFF